MKTCKDCIHYEACHRKDREIPANTCRTFKDKSLVLELPCKVGDTVYEIVNNEINEVKIAGIACFMSNADSCAMMRTDMMIHTRCHKGLVTVFDLSAFSDILFSTKESAEQALKECEQG